MQSTTHEEPGDNPKSHGWRQLARHFYIPIRPASVTANISGMADAFYEGLPPIFRPCRKIESTMLRELSKPKTDPFMKGGASYHFALMHKKSVLFGLYED